MGFLKQNGGAIVAGLVELLIVILLFVDTVGFASGILMDVGVILFLCGVVCLIRYFRTEPVQAALEQNFSKGLIMILLGVLFVLWTETIITLFPFARLCGVAILIIGVVKLQQGVDLLRLKSRFWFLAGINALLAIVFAAIILSDPPILWQLAAISLIVEAILDIAVLFLNRNSMSTDF